MTHKIHHSKISDPAAFDKAVRAHAAELTAHQVHMKAVAQGKAQAYPPPSVHPEIDAAIRRVKNADGYFFIVDYQIVDMIPIENGDVAAFNTRKEELTQQVLQMEQAAISALLPKGKWRLLHLQYQDTQEIKEKSDSDLAFIARYEALRKSVKNIQRHQAELESQMEDLDFHTINTWKPTPFQG